MEEIEKKAEMEAKRCPSSVSIHILRMFAPRLL
jgi:hypothetical protein